MKMIPPYIYKAIALFCAVSINTAHAARDMVEPIFNQGVVAMYNWSQPSAVADLINAMKVFTISGRNNALNALEQSGLLQRARKEDASCSGFVLQVPQIRESVDRNGLLQWEVSAPIRITLKRGSKELVAIDVNATARITMDGAPGKGELKIDGLSFTENKAK